MNQKLKTPQEVRADFERRGISISSWARANGFSRNLVSAVLREERPCRIGKSHEIAVLLGIKDGVISRENCNTFTEKGVATSLACHQDATPQKILV